MFQFLIITYSQRGWRRFAASTYFTTSTRRQAGEFSCGPVSKKE
jgi:hypothetical protein